MKSKIIAVSAISAALTAVFLIIGAYFELADLFAVIIASCFPLMPLYFKSYKGCFLSYLVGGIIAFLCSGFNVYSIVFPSYIALFGIYPIIRCKMQDANINKVFRILIGLVWFIAAFYGLYFYYTLIMNGLFDGLPQWMTVYSIYLVGLVAVLFYFVYDRFVLVVRKVTQVYLDKILK